jgi:hypothetical protein
MLERSQGQRFTFNSEFRFPLEEGKESLPASRNKGRFFGGMLRGKSPTFSLSPQCGQQLPRLISLNTALNMRMVNFQLLDLLSNKAQTDASVKEPSGLLCSILMKCHYCYSMRKSSSLKPVQ